MTNLKAKTEATEMLGPYGDPITVIEYERTKSGWKPHSVVCGHDDYDFNWCEQDKVLAYHWSGGGGDTGSVYLLSKFCNTSKLCAKLWYDHDCRLMHDKKPISDKEVRALGYQIVNGPIDGNPFYDPDSVEDETEYCTVCEDHHPRDSMCDHVQYDDEDSEWRGGCGASDVDFMEAQKSLYRLLRRLPPKDVEQMRLRALATNLRVDRNLIEEFNRERRGEERYWPGIAWLASIDAGCKNALALTAGWIRAFQRTAWRACCVASEHRFCAQLSSKELAPWLAVDPLEPRELHDRSLLVKLGFKPQSANDVAFLKDPTRCEEVTLWPRKQTDDPGITLSVAEVEYEPRRKAVRIFFGAVLERNCQLVSELDGYLIRVW